MTISLVTYPLQMVFLEGGFYFARQVAEHKMISDVHHLQDSRAVIWAVEVIKF